MYYSIDIGKNIAHLRKLRGFSQEQLAEKAEISVGWLREIEHDRANVTRDILERLAEALEAAVWMLYTYQLDIETLSKQLSAFKGTLERNGEVALV